MILPIIGCSLIGSVALIGICSSITPTITPINLKPTVVMEERLSEDLNPNLNKENSLLILSVEEDAIRSDFREGIARRSIQILRSQDMSDKEIKSELLQDFSLTEEHVDEMLAAHQRF